LINDTNNDSDDDEIIDYYNLDTLKTINEEKVTEILQDKLNNNDDEDQTVIQVKTFLFIFLIKDQILSCIYSDQWKTKCYLKN
jgi:hypothetical protein